MNRPAELKRNLLYVISAETTNIGLSAIAESCGIPYDVLAWTAEWYFRLETLEATNAAVVNLQPPAAADPCVRLRGAVVIGRAAVSGQGQVDHGAARCLGRPQEPARPRRLAHQREIEVRPRRTRRPVTQLGFEHLRRPAYELEAVDQGFHPG
nr:transposase [Micromonospora zingiberis]